MNSFSNYQDFLNEVKKQIQTARMKAVLSANSQMLKLYWWIGNAILKQQSTEGWGTKVIKRISTDLKEAFPDMKSMSERNLKYMRAFAVAYPSFVQGALAQNTEDTPLDSSTANMQESLAQITWYHHIALLEKLKDEDLRYFYIEKTIENGWSRDVMVNQIESGLHQRQGKIQNNFLNTLPAQKSDLAKQLFKDPYKFDFFQLTEEANERELEDALVNHIYKFLLELGKGFAFMGRQVHLKKGDQDYYLDLLFYHTKLRCHVILELKIGDFKPEYAGKMNFYISIVDDEYKSEEDGPTIGIILCKSKNKVTAEYALRDIYKPMGIAEYQLTAAIPESLKAELPSIEDLEEELEKDLVFVNNSVGEKLDKLNRLVGLLNHPEVKQELSANITQFLFTNVLADIVNQIAVILAPVFSLFSEHDILYSINERTDYFVSVDLEKRLTKEQVNEIGLEIRLSGFKKAGTKSFNTYSTLRFYLNRFKYQIGKDRRSIMHEHLYDKEWSSEDILQLANEWAEIIIENISSTVENLTKSDV